MLFVQMSTLNIPLFLEKIEKTSLNYHHLPPNLTPWNNTQWLEVPMFRTNFQGPKMLEPLKFDGILYGTKSMFVHAPVTLSRLFRRHLATYGMMKLAITRCECLIKYLHVCTTISFAIVAILHEILAISYGFLRHSFRHLLTILRL